LAGVIEVIGLVLLDGDDVVPLEEGVDEGVAVGWCGGI